MADRVVPGAPVTPVTAGGAGAPAVRAGVRRRYHVLSRTDRIILGLMVAIPTAMVVIFVLLPTLLSIVLSFTSWNGIGGLDRIKFIGIKNYTTLFQLYAPFWPAVAHNVIWLLFFLFLATPLGMFMAVLLDKELRGTAFYQGALFLPVVLSLALVGFIWQLIYAPDQGLLNQALGTTSSSPGFIDWLGNPSINLWAVLVAASWRQVGYVMVLYLAGLKAVDPSLREAAKVDGASEVQTFFYVVFPVMRPINIVILVITIIESLRAFDLAFIINKGINGLELLSILVTNNIIGESSQVGFGSAIAVVLLVISIGPIVIYLSRALREDNA